MSTQPQRQPDPESRQTHSRRHGVETRLAIVETRWQDVVPTLATKSDLREAIGGLRAELKEDTAKLHTEIAVIRKDVEAMGNKLLIRLAGVLIAVIGAAVAVLRYWPAP